MDLRKIVDTILSYTDCDAMSVDVFNRTVPVLVAYVDKYRWHDLVKNPDELPEVLQQVLVKVQIGSDDYEYITASRVTGNDNGWTCFGYPVAWREIELFD